MPFQKYAETTMETQPLPPPSTMMTMMTMMVRITTMLTFVDEMKYLQFNILASLPHQNGENS